MTDRDLSDGADDAGEALAEVYAARHPRQAAAVLGRFEPAMAAAFLSAREEGLAGRLLAEMSPDRAAACLTAMTDADAAIRLGAMPRRAAASVLRRLAPSRRGAVQQAMPRATRLQLDLILHQPGHRIGAWIDPQVPAVQSGTTAEDARQAIAALQLPVAEAYLVDSGQRLLGSLSLARLAAAPAAQPVDGLARPVAASLRANQSVEVALAAPAWDTADCLPVLDGEGRLVGLLRHAALRRAARQDNAARSEVPADEYVSLANTVYVGLAEILATAIGRSDRPVRGAARPGRRGPADRGGEDPR
ncbi:magnesium transporter MgtE N-terminal domain-containing protein [Marinibaculum pumilum]|uniref:Magnesium transporter MgtE N-terminal domain-containing protein n=1 Tax=Marinibaculum pumilum TaxID=1766165 RepID=A0ABV7L7T5_9PROT